MVSFRGEFDGVKRMLFRRTSGGQLWWCISVEAWSRLAGES